MGKTNCRSKIRNRTVHCFHTFLILGSTGQTKEMQMSGALALPSYRSNRAFRIRWLNRSALEVHIKWLHSTVMSLTEFNYTDNGEFPCMPVSWSICILCAKLNCTQDGAVVQEESSWSVQSEKASSLVDYQLLQLNRGPKCTTPGWQGSCRNIKQA